MRAFLRDLIRSGATPAAFLSGVLLSTLTVLLQRPSGIVLYTDEAGYTAPARVLAGTAESANLAGLQLYSPVYSVILVPFVAITRSSPWLIAVLVNVGLVGVLAVVCTRLALDLGVHGRAAWIVGSLGCVPAVVLQVPRAWPEVTLAVLLAIWVKLVTSGDHRALWWAGVIAAGTFGVHNRMIGVLAAWVAIGAFTAVRHHEWRRRFATALLPVIAILAGSRILTNWVVAEMYGGTAETRGFRIVDRVLNPAYWDDVLVSAGGQLWTLSVGTIGLAVIGVVALVRTAFRLDPPLGEQIGGGSRSASVAVLLAFFATVAVGGLFLAGSIDRSDHPVYGRYLEVFGPVLTVYGVAWMRAARRRQAVVAGLVSCGSLLLFVVPLWRFGADAFASNIQKLTIAGLLPLELLFDDAGAPFIGELDLVWVGLTAMLACATVMALLTIRWQTGVTAILAVWVLLIGAASFYSLRPFLNEWEPAGDVAVDLVGEGRSVGRLADLTPTALTAFESEAGYAVTQVVDPTVCPTDTTYVLAPARESVGFDAEVVATMFPIPGVLLRVSCG